MYTLPLTLFNKTLLLIATQLSHTISVFPIVIHFSRVLTSKS